MFYSFYKMHKVYWGVITYIINTVRHNKTRLILHNSQFTTPKYYIPPTMLPIFFGCKDIRPLGRALVGRIVVPFLSPGHPPEGQDHTLPPPKLYYSYKRDVLGGKCVVAWAYDWPVGIRAAL